MIETFLYSITFFITKQTASQTIKGCFAWNLGVGGVFKYLQFGFSYNPILTNFTHNFTFTDTFVLILRNTLENAARIRIRILFLVIFFIFLMFFALFVFLHLFSTFEKFVAWLTFVYNFTDCARVGTYHLCLFLLKDVLTNRSEFSHSSFCIVNMEFSGQMKLIIDHRVKFNMTC